MAKNRYYYYDHDACAFVEVGETRSRSSVRLSALTAVVLVLAFATVWLLEGRLVTPYEVALKAENQALQQQLSSTRTRMKRFSTELAQMAKVDQSLYRTLLQADPIPQDVRQAGAGGSDPYQSFDRFSPSTATLLHRSAEQLDQLERQINVQNASYRELTRLAEKRSEWLAQMPAIVPADGPVVSSFGMRMHPILHINRMHAGIDVLVRSGSPVVATGDGVVKATGRNRGFGNYVQISHPATGYTTLYAHLSSIPKDIRPGKKVKRGERIALSGNTGLSTGPHLHYEVRDSNGHPLNPIYFFAPSMTPHEYRKLLKVAASSHIALD
ncbi:MAG TPA: M23 family metallopeptidase [Rhodothermales bacterium]|nr:M23 family metallopeptidase [Rhodothermales bacterium]